MASMAIVTTIYFLTNVAYFAVLTPSEILSSNAVAVTFGNRVMGIIAWIISVFVACSVFGNLNGRIITTSRVFYAGAKEGHLPKFLSLIHVKNNTPGMAIIAVIICTTFPIFMEDIGSILTYMSFVGNFMNLLCILGFLWLRYKEPKRDRPIKVWCGFPFVYLMVNIFVTVFPIIQRPIEIAIASGVLFMGLVVYYFAIHKQSKILGRCVDKVYHFCQIVFQSVEEEKIK
ncbi:Y+L amino acid transporter 2 [Halocaridina rubra]|uniref:Y+L amino acid transporter 2 n=1 Tax=Halocaridina rubra TaxID=373956 RepID=A0AAN8X239_HALRR